MKSILLPRSYSSPSGVINIANEVLRGGFDEFPDLMYETIYVFSGSNGRCRLVAKIDVEVEGYRIEVVDRPWFDGEDGYQPGDWLKPGEGGRAIDEPIEKAEKRTLYTPYIDIGKLDCSGNERWVKIDAAVTLGELEIEE